VRAAACLTAGDPARVVLVPFCGGLCPRAILEFLRAAPVPAALLPSSPRPSPGDPYHVGPPSFPAALPIRAALTRPLCVRGPHSRFLGDLRASEPPLPADCAPWCRSPSPALFGVGSGDSGPACPTPRVARLPPPVVGKGHPVAPSSSSSPCGFRSATPLSFSPALRFSRDRGPAPGDPSRCVWAFRAPPPVFTPWASLALPPRALVPRGSPPCPCPVVLKRPP